MHDPQKQNRRNFLMASAIGAGSVLWNRHGSARESADENRKFSLHAWERDPRNPVFIPKSPFDARGSQGPCVVPNEGRWWMFYGGHGTDDKLRICLATASPDRPTEWERLGPVIDLGGPGSFDEVHCIYPCVHRFGDQWHLYYSARSTRVGPQNFSQYWGIGLATSDNLRDWKKHPDSPVLLGDGVPQYPDNRALVGLGNILELPQPDGRTLYRLHYTILPGGTERDPNHKVCAAAESFDGIEWKNRRVVLDRRQEAAYENTGVVGLHVWKTKTRYRAIYTGMDAGLTYSLCEAVSKDGLTWERGAPGENVSLSIRPNTWESGTIGYPHLLREADALRVFYNGARGYGSTGIGMVTAPMLD